MAGARLLAADIRYAVTEPMSSTTITGLLRKQATYIGQVT